MLSVLHQSFWDRLVGVLALKRPVYKALQYDAMATGQALLIVAFLGLANGISMIVTPVVILLPDVSDDMAQVAAQITAALTFDTPERQLLALAAGVAVSIVSWYLSSWLLCAIGNRVAPRGANRVSNEEMRRLEGWGYAPSLAAFLTPIPLVGPLLATLGALWSLVTGVMALRAAFDIGIGKAIAIEIAAFLIVLLLVLLLLVIILMFAWPSP